MSHLTLRDGAEMFFKDLGDRHGIPLVFSHGWPLSADEWEPQLFYFTNRGFRCIAHDRRGHGRSSQSWKGHDMDTYADDLLELVEHLDLAGAVHIGHSTGGGEVTRYLGRHGGSKARGRVSKAVLIGAVPPIMVRSANNPTGLPKDQFDTLRAALLADHAQFFRDLPAGPFYGFNRPDAAVSSGLIDNWWRQAMMAGIHAAHDCIAAFSETDFTDDLRSITVPTLIMHGDDDQIVPIAGSARLSAKLVPGATLKVYEGYDHGMAATHHPEINADLLAFIRS